MESNQVIEELQKKASEKFKANIIKLGIPEENTIGVSTAELRKMAKQLSKEKDFLFELWETGYHESKILAVLALRADDCTDEDIEKIMTGIVSWDLYDLFCKNILIKIDYPRFISEWITTEELYYKRAAFTLIANTSMHAKLSNKEIANYLELILRFSNDDRVLVKKAASWALRELGKTHETAKEMSIATANQLLESDSKAQIWIAKDALKELTTLVKTEGRGRLISAKSKMGRAVN